MPRRNKRKTAVTEPHIHAPSPYARGYKQKCKGCAFAGLGSVCLTSDGKCLKLPKNRTNRLGWTQAITRRHFI
jgi:hypothetical protein